MQAQNFLRLRQQVNDTNTLEHNLNYILKIASPTRGITGHCNEHSVPSRETVRLRVASAKNRVFFADLSFEIANLSFENKNLGKKLSKIRLPTKF